MTQNETDDDGATDDSPRPPDGDIAGLERELAERGETYARITVVRREAPVSANVGDRAVVTADGTLHGWIGGVACAQTTAISQATEALADGEPRLVGIAPDPDDVARPGLEAFPMHCHSEGVLELFIEPVNTAPALLIVGGSPIARSLSRLSAELDIDVTVVDPDGADDLPVERTLTTTDPETIVEAVGTGPLVVVASVGQYDARGVAAGIRADAPYIGLVASSARNEEVIDRVADRLETDRESVAAAVTNPAGIDITAHTPGEIATSILAEVVDARAGSVEAAPRAEVTGADSSAAGDDTTTAADDDAVEEAVTDDHGEDDGERAGLATDPVCGMTADPETAPAVDHGGTTYYFCCEGCAGSFRDDPEAYLDEGQGVVSP
ncbi:XdhC family protein [Halobellus ordinarius]|uniref:XdhC family protein n=1 Tax=Halobellus ordinarius TaxID=3075120 RepID=UPI0028802331|nr:XdhC family protein [Halobellus sp. ZY16]